MKYFFLISVMMVAVVHGLGAMEERSSKRARLGDTQGVSLADMSVQQRNENAMQSVLANDDLLGLIQCHAYAALSLARTVSKKWQSVSHEAARSVHNKRFWSLWNTFFKPYLKDRDVDVPVFKTQQELLSWFTEKPLTVRYDRRTLCLDSGCAAGYFGCINAIQKIDAIAKSYGASFRSQYLSNVCLYALYGNHPEIVSFLIRSFPEVKLNGVLGSYRSGFLQQYGLKGYSDGLLSLFAIALKRRLWHIAHLLVSTVNIDEELVRQCLLPQPDRTSITYLLDQGANPNYQQHPGANTPLSYLVSRSQSSIGVLKLLLDRGAQASINTSFSVFGRMYTPIECALFNGNVEAVRLLSEYGALYDINKLKSIAQFQRPYGWSNTLRFLERVLHDREVL